jgi:hypothetical protein
VLVYRAHHHGVVFLIGGRSGRAAVLPASPPLSKPRGERDRPAKIYHMRGERNCPISKTPLIFSGRFQCWRSLSLAACFGT